MEWGIMNANFRRGASWLLALAEAGGHDAVRALQALEGNLGTENVKLAFFRCYETMASPDILLILPDTLFKYGWENEGLNKV